ncbi:MAG TPA: glycoside hydrolase family 13 protein [Candidatus Nanopelagicales bacterium]|nr:glycoside hydrolase family 13 protein [Candidatus Nanopelagicales bacterium]
MTTPPDVCAYRRSRPWWRDAVVYQVYPRSFADLDGDGIGDLPGVSDRLDYLAGLGVDAIWISPFYASPLNDGGYDVADYRAVDPRLGTIADVDALITGAHDRGLRVLMDIVPNHTSSEHAWFQEVLNSPPGSPGWSRYVIREGAGPDHDEPPNNWRSVFHGRGWSRLVLADGTVTNYWYLHLFDDTQPDLDWTNPQVRAEFESVLRFWFDRGIDGFRIDVAHGLAKDPHLPDMDYDSLPEAEILGVAPEAPYWDQDEVHDIYREWRAIADEYDPPRILCGETWAPSAERLALYQRPDELHTSFNFDYLAAGWDAKKMRRSIDETLASHAEVGAPATWVLSNHDVIRHATRFAPSPDGTAVTGSTTVDAAVGLQRARAATVFMFGLPGSAYMYQGEELGLPEVLDLPDDARQDPVWRRSGGEFTGRDGCRVPIPWSGTQPSYGFGPSESSWLPQPQEWGRLSVAAQEGDEASTLELYRRTLARRRREPALGDGPMAWLEDAPAGVLAMHRFTPESDEPGVLVVVNTTDSTVHLPEEWGTEVLVESGSEVACVDVEGREYLALGSATAVWLRR